jgi:DNA polymerase III epsilon subunit-like protein
MNITQAIELASSLFIPEFLLADGIAAVESERARTEEAIRALRDEWFAQAPGEETFSFDLARELADRNRQLCDLVECSDDPAAQQLARRRRESSGLNLARSLTLDELTAGVAALQRRSPKKVARIVAQDPDNLAVAYVDAPVKGTVVGIDIETTGRHPDRGYIINVGWETMDLTPDACPRDAMARWCGLPPAWEGRPIPLEEIHHITPDMIAGKRPFREDKQLQKELLALLCSHPYLAHNAAFEDSWFMLHLDGYAEARKAGKIIPIDTRDICRRVDKDAVGLPRESHPNTLENWARRRGTLEAGEDERHLGLDDTELMLRTVQAEFTLRNMFFGSAAAKPADGSQAEGQKQDGAAAEADPSPTPRQRKAGASKSDASPKKASRSKKKRGAAKADEKDPAEAVLREAVVAEVARALAPSLARAASQGPDALAAWCASWVAAAAATLPAELAEAVHVGEPDLQGFVASLSSASGGTSHTYQARLSVVDQTSLAQALAAFAADLAQTRARGSLPAEGSLLACFL